MQWRLSLVILVSSVVLLISCPDSGGRQADDIVNWVTKKSGPPAKPLSSLAELKEFLERDDKVCIVGLFSDESSDAAKSFLQVADSIDESPFAISSEAELLKEYNVDKNKVIVFKKVCWYFS